MANAPRAEFNSIGVPQNQQLAPFDSSRWAWLAAQNYAGVSSPNAGTLTFGRQNALTLDGNNAYDPMGGSYAFSVIGYSGKNGGGGDTENGRWTTAIKYRVNLGDGRFSAMVQPIGLFGRWRQPLPAIRRITPITARSKWASAGTSSIGCPA